MNVAFSYRKLEYPSASLKYGLHKFQHVIIDTV